MATELKLPLRITAVAVSDVQAQQMGVTAGIKGRFTLVDDQMTVLAFLLCHKFSERTYRIYEHLCESMELDVADILARPGGSGDDVEYLPEPEDGENGGMSFQ